MGFTSAPPEVSGLGSVRELGEGRMEEIFLSLSPSGFLVAPVPGGMGWKSVGVF